MFMIIGLVVLYCLLSFGFVIGYLQNTDFTTVVKLLLIIISPVLAPIIFGIVIGLILYDKTVDIINMYPQKSKTYESKLVQRNFIFCVFLFQRVLNYPRDFGLTKIEVYDD